jgi:hypothetical protein
VRPSFENTKHKIKGLGSGSSGRVCAYQELIPKFKPQYHQKWINKKINKRQEYFVFSFLHQDL